MLNIIKGIFGVDPTDLLPGLAKTKNPLEGGMFPDLTTKMFIGEGGLSNLEKSGVNLGNAMERMSEIESDWLNMPVKAFDDKWGKTGFLIDPPTGKAMYEISDKEVKLKDGINLKTLPEDSLLTVDELFNMPTLKKAYPGIEDIKVGFIDDSKSARLAAYSPTDNSILFNRQHPDWDKYNPTATVLHEAQHYVQGKEMFTKGAGFTDMLKKDGDYVDAFAELAPAVNPKSSAYKIGTKTGIKKFLASNNKMGFSEGELSTAIERLGREDGLDAYTSLKRSLGEDRAAKLIAFGSQIPEISNILAAKEQASKLYNKNFADYLRVSGEVFARQTEQRAGMTTAQRRAESIYRTIDSDPLNRRYNVTVDNMTASPEGGVADSMKPVLFTDNLLKDQSNRLKNPIKLQDGSRLSGFTSNTRTHFFGYDKNGEMFTIEAKYVNPADIVGSRDSDKTAARIAESLGDVYVAPEPVQFTDPMASSIQSSIPQGL